MTARDAVRLWPVLRPRTPVPVHYEGWTHFHEGRAEATATFAAAPPQLRECLRWLDPGVATGITTGTRTRPL